MLDLFDAPLLPGLATRANLITADEERMLIDRIDATDLEPFRFQGWTGKRLTTSFGWSYDFEVGRPKDAPPMPDWLLPIRNRAANFARLAPEALIQALLICYDPAPVSAGIVTGRSTAMSLASSLANRRRCASGSGAPAASTVCCCRSIRGAAIIWTEPLVTTESTASLHWNRCGGRGSRPSTGV